ncbi:MAG: AI-2E family transporter [Chloroflexi bacterium]|nr:AI-2E family transporter [Chloroflexota bacterium]
MTSPPFKVNRLIWFLVGAIVVCVLLYQLRSAIVPFIVGGALAYVLAPFVSWLERLLPWMSSRSGLKRALLIGFIFIVVALSVIAAVVAVIPPTIAELRHFIELLPQLMKQSSATFQKWNAQFEAGVPPEMQVLIRDSLHDAGEALRGMAKGFILRTVEVIASTFNLLVGLAMVPLILFYLLKDKEKLTPGMLSLLPREWHRHARQVIITINTVLGAYVRGQLMLGLAVGVAVTIGLWILGVRFAPALGLVAGIFELVPIIGPWLGAIPGIFVVLATAPEKFIWVALLYLGVQLVENTILVPRIQSEALDIHPLVVLASLVIGSEFAGLWGFILGPPLAAILYRLHMYFLSVWNSDDAMDQERAIPPDEEESEDELHNDDAEEVSTDR